MPTDPTRYADLLEAIRKVSSNLDNDQVLHFIIDAVTRLMNAESGSVVLVDEDDKSLYFAAVGNEVMYRNDLTEEELLEDLQYQEELRIYLERKDILEKGLKHLYIYFLILY